jgi:3-hydroxyacyl-CoA dehydrogenase/enoyl-CoA hydratase/3-hydroxybutyryl-CoA epimerase
VWLPFVLEGDRAVPCSWKEMRIKRMTNIIKNIHWRLEKDDDNIAWLYFDKADTKTNVLSADVIEELDLFLLNLSFEKIRGLIILSDKKNGFIAGADIKEFTRLKDSSDAEKLIRSGQTVFDRLENMQFPTVSLIHGFCLGGGLELALACRYRVAEDHRRTKLGLPEVKLGIHPGFGGTVRLPRLIGAPKAMELMLTGRTIDVRKAKKIGLIDYAVPSRHLKKMARLCIEKHLPERKPSLKLQLTNNMLVRPLIKKTLIRNVKRRVQKVHYPAPYAMIELWDTYAGNPQRMLAEEARSVSELITGTTAKNLVRVFLLMEKLKSMGRGTDFHASHVHVIGAGIMGGDIAAWCALRGLNVTLQDREAKYIAPAMKRAYKLFKKHLRTPRLVQSAMDRLMPDVNGRTGLKRADVVIEAIFENIEAKQNLFREIEPIIKPDALLATNTSSIPLEDLNRSLSRPERLVGLHFFNPVAKMQLVEIVASAATGKDEINRAKAFTRQIDRLPLPVRSTPGFLVNRVLMPYLLEAVSMIEEGVSPAAIDRAAVDFGMPMGPILLADTVGLDICLHVAEIISKGLHITIPDRLRQLVKEGRLGKKSGQGFYKYKKGKQVAPGKSSSRVSAEDLRDRLILRMVNEAVCCLNEGVVDDADLIDAGIIFGTGFAPFRGGPLNYRRTEGIYNLRSRMEELEEHYGKRFHPANILEGAAT